MLLKGLRRLCFCDITSQNRLFATKMTAKQRALQKYSRNLKAKQSDFVDFVKQRGPQKLAQQAINYQSQNEQIADYISKFNKKHEGRIKMMDFSEYATTFGEIKQKPLRQQDIDILRQFHRRKVDQRIHQLYNQDKNPNAKKSPLPQLDNMLSDPDEQSIFQKQLKTQGLKNNQNPRFKRKRIFISNQTTEGKQGPFHIRDDFVILLLSKGVTTKVTTLNRINSFRVLLYMGNGNGLISQGKARAKTYRLAMTRAMQQLKKNIIAIPLDQKCTLPVKITKTWQDYKLQLRPLPGYNSWGNPVFSIMLALSGITHAGFKTVHTGKNPYNMVNVLFKALTKNTTPQELAEQYGFKVYRQQFTKPLTSQPMNQPLSR